MVNQVDFAKIQLKFLEKFVLSSARNLFGKIASNGKLVITCLGSQLPNVNHNKEIPLRISRFAIIQLFPTYRGINFHIFIKKVILIANINVRVF